MMRRETYDHRAYYRALTEVLPYVTFLGEHPRATIEAGHAGSKQLNLVSSELQEAVIAPAATRARCAARSRWLRRASR